MIGFIFGCIGFIFGCICVVSFFLGKIYGKSLTHKDTLENPKKAEELRERLEKFKEKYRH